MATAKAKTKAKAKPTLKKKKVKAQTPQRDNAPASMLEEEDDQPLHKETFSETSLVPVPAGAPYEIVRITPHALSRDRVVFPEMLPQSSVIVKLWSMLISAADLRVYFGIDKTARVANTFGDSYIGEVMWSASSKVKRGEYVTTCKPCGIGEYIVADVANLQVVDKPMSRYLAAPIALCASAVKQGLATYLKVNADAVPKEIVVLGNTSHATLISMLHRGGKVSQFTGHKLSLLDGTYDMVFDCRIAADEINAAQYVRGNGVYVNVIPGTQGATYCNKVERADGGSYHALYLCYSGETFEEYLHAYQQSAETSQIIEASAVDCTMDGLVSALGQKNGLVRLNFKR